MNAKVFVTLKKGVLDPQGKAVQHSLGSLGYGNVQDVRLGKYVEIKLDETDKAKADSQLREMCDKLLANTVIEDYHFVIE